MRYILVTLAALAAGLAALGQGPTRQAAPIDRAALERLNLRAEWNAYIPITGKKDGLVLVQPVDDQQVYVETRAGLLVALDARTGRQQWSYKFPISFSGNLGVAVNAEYCFAVSVGKLYCFSRYTGALQLEQELREVYPHHEETPISGPVADSLHVYIQMASGTLVCYTMPQFLRPKELAGPSAGASAKNKTNVADQVANQLGTNTMPPLSATSEADGRPRTNRAEGGDATNTMQSSPSLSTLFSVIPPYQLNRDRPVPSLSAIPTVVHPPHKLVPDHMKYTQPSPSVSSQSALYRLDEDSNLRAAGDKFKRQWRYPMPQAAFGSPLLYEQGTDNRTTRLWISTVGKSFVELPSPWIDAEAYVRQPLEPLPIALGGLPLHPMVGPFELDQSRLVGYVPLDNGKLRCVTLLDMEDLAESKEVQKAPRKWDTWEAPVSGQMTNAPIVGVDAVYASGPRSGVAKVDSKTGDLAWRTASDVDQVLAVNREYVYARDHRGRLTVYAVNSRPDPRSKTVRPAATLDLPEFTVGVSNGMTDRILLGGDNGLIVCLRDAAAAYARPVRIAPPATLPKPAAPKPADKPPMAEPKN